MPVYEYICLECKKEFEVVERIAEHGDKRARCPRCRSTRVERHWSSVFVETSKKS
jgi:putative FmdB family regulatory protein